MTDFQQVIFSWVTSQPAATGAVLLAAGLLSGFLGFRMIRFLVVLSCGGLGGLAGAFAAGLAEYPLAIPAVAGGFFGVVAGLAWPRVALAVSAGGTLAFMGSYLAMQLGFRGNGVWITFALCGAAGTALGLLSRQTMALVSTTLQGAVLMIVGFVGLSNGLLPSLGATFQSWARGSSMMVPLLLTMVTATAYSVQCSKQQGDICTGR